MAKLFGSLIAILTLLGMPLFAVMGGITLLSWATADDPKLRFFRNIAANVLEEKFSSSPILVTIPLFTFAGYLMAESKTPDRIVRAAGAALGWMPGGLAVVCIFASAFFTTMTGGSGVTIVAIGGLLYPALIKQGYSEKFALGLVTTAGAVGLLFFPSPLVMVYAFVANVDMNQAYLSTFPPGVFLMLILCGYAMWVGYKSKVPRQPFRLLETLEAMWAMKWEIGAPLLVGAGLFTGLMSLDESAAAAALYILVVEVYIYKDLSWQKVLRVAKDSMALAGAIIIILAMATALTNYITLERIPQAILEWFEAKGMTEAWHFIIVLNIFLLILGMLMDAISALLVALPLLIPLAAKFDIPPFYLAVMFLLNLEIAYVTPPVGLNLYIASFRFRRSVVDVYRVVLPFVGLLAAGLVAVILWPGLSSFTVTSEIEKLRAEAAEMNMSPREAWILECVQEDRSDPRPCRDEDEAKWGEDGRTMFEQPLGPITDEPDEDGGGDEMDDLMKEMMGEDGDSGGDEMDDLMKEMMGEDAEDSGDGEKTDGDDMDDLMKEMMEE